MRVKNPRAGIRFGEYAGIIGLARSTLYELPAELQPHSVYVGTARIVTEDPRAYLQRLAAAKSGLSQSSTQS